MTGRAKSGTAATGAVKPKIIDRFDASTLVGLNTIVCDSAYEEIDSDGDTLIEIPNLRALMASAAVARCLMPVRLRGYELRAMRKIMGLTLSGLAERLDAKTAPETISRWESEAQPIGGFAGKVLRLLVCDALHKEAKGVSYDPSMIVNMRVKDPWITNAEYRVPPMEFRMVKMKEDSGTIVDVYNNSDMAA